MTSTELSTHHRVQFRLAGKLVQGLVIGNKRKKVVVMQHRGDGDWRPIFIPLDLLTHINFQHAFKLFMPLYNPIMEEILQQAREGKTEILY